ncbi:cadherin domain-containing protein [Candidatus Poriferisodalis sp.]|uniref:cadherin domain-containing protein n=1 Tax=Candidatus Poriferisodalis sp. TaxID=3101277 RepID=UPI003AF8DF45
MFALAALVAVLAVGHLTVGQAAAASDDVPEVPQNIAGVALHYGRVSLDWDDAADADSYEVEYFDGQGWLRLPSATQGILAIFSGSSVILDGLENERRIEVRIRAVNSAGTSAWSGIYSMPATATLDFSGVPLPGFPGAPTITSADSYEVDEGATSIATLGATDHNTAESDLVWTVAGGADAARFVLSESGVLAFDAAPDYEEPDDIGADGIYELTVQVSDGTNDVTADVSVTLRNVIELEAAQGSSEVSFAENGWSKVATFTASSSQDRDGITWTLGGDDAAHFSIDEPSGALRFDLDPVAPVIVAKPPDFEVPVDSDNDNAYVVTLLASSASATADTALSVTVTVTDADEDGAVSLSTKRPRTGVAVTAALDDPDGVVDDSATWVWERSVGYNEWAAIAGAEGSSYTPAAADAGSFLRVGVSYSDNHGSDAHAQATATEVAAAAQLSGLSVSTDDSDLAIGADAWRQMRPAFDAQTLHYSVGCNDTDTMTLTMHPADATSRISVDGTQVANAGAGVAVTATVPVTGTSSVRVALSNAQGAVTHYVVHCFADEVRPILVHKPLGEAGALDELILFSQSNHLIVMDHNGVPRVLRRVGQAAGGYFRFYPDINGEPRYSYQRRLTWILDENLDELAVARTVPPLTRQDGHDFRLLDNGNYMLMAYQGAERDPSYLTFDDSSGAPFGTDVYVEDSVIQIVTPGGSETFRWNSWDHMALEDCVQHRFPPVKGDYAHLNTMQMADGRIIASMRGCSRVLAIDAVTGDVLWRVGPSNLSDAEWAERDIGPPPLDIIGDPEKQFCGQHASSLLPNGNLILYDNGVECTKNPWTLQNLLRENDMYSRGLEYALDLDNGEAVFVRDHSLHGTKSELGYRGGHIEGLGNGHWLISWGGANRTVPFAATSDVFTQVDPDTGSEWLSVGGTRTNKATVMAPEALARAPAPPEARVLAGSYTSVAHSGVGDAPQVAVAFNRPVADFAKSSPSLSVQGATVTTVVPHLVAGEAANAYLVTLAPAGAGAISVAFVAGEACDDGGVCAADGMMLASVPPAVVIGPPVTVTFGAASYSVAEGATLQVSVELSRAHGGGLEIEVPIVASALSASFGEFTVASGVSFAAGETRKTVSFDAGDDAVVEGSETVVLSFGALASGFSAGMNAETTVTITDTDTAVIGFSAASNEVAEGGETELTFAVTNGVTFAADQAIGIAAAGSADAGDDFVLTDSVNRTLSAPYSVTLAAGATSVTAGLRAVDDSDAELAETVVLSARLASTGALIGSRTVTVPASDLGTPEVTITGGGTVTEGDDAVFTLARSATLGTPLTEALTVSVEVTATGGILSGASASTVTFAAGQSTAEVRAGTVDDSVVEDPATVTALVRADTASPARYVTGSPNRATVAVWDNDVVRFGVSVGLPAIVEGAEVTVTVDTGGVTFAQAQSLSVSVAGSAAVGDDFVLTDSDGTELVAPYELTLGAGAGSTSFGIAAAIDEVEDDGEAVVLAVLHDGQSVATVTVTVIDENELPMVMGPSDVRFAENGNAAVATFTATDAEGDPVTWSLGGADAARFRFDTAAGELGFRSPPDFEMRADAGADNVYDVAVQASDSEGTTSHHVTVTVTDVDEPAIIASVSGSFEFSYDENDMAPVAAFTATDPERATIRWSLGAVDAAVFRISSGGVVSFERPPDFEHPDDDDNNNEYVVQVQARAGASDLVVRDVLVTVDDVDEPGMLVLSPPQPQVGTPVGAAVVDPDGFLAAQEWTWQRRLGGGPWGDIAGATTGSYTPVAADERYRLRVEVSYLDGTGTGTDTVAAETAYPVRAAPIALNNAPDFGDDPVARSVAENSPPGTAVGATVTATDSDSGDADRLIYTLSVPDDDLFTIDGSTGQIRVGSAAVLDHESAGRPYSVTVTAADPSGASDDVTVIIRITDVNEPPVAAEDTAVTAEDSRVVIAVLTNDADPDGDILTVALGDASLHGRVSVEADNTLAYTPTSDFNGRDIFTYVVSDGRLSDETTVTVTVNAVNDQPKFPTASTTRTIAEGASAAAPVGHPVTATDVDAEPLTYRLFEVDAPSFTIDSGSGQIGVGPDTVPDRRTQPSYRLRVQATDPHGARASTTVIVTVTAPRTTPGTGPLRGGGGGGAGGGGGGGGGGGFEPSTAVVIVASGWSPSDIGVASALSARTPDSAVIYTAGDRLSVAARDLLVDYLPAGVIVVGGETAVSAAALTSMRRASESDSVERITGATRSDTAASVARRILDASEAGGATVIIANGWSPADIGVAAALSARTPRSAVAYTTSGALPDATQRLLRDYRPARVLIVGGEAAVEPAAVSQMSNAVPGAIIERVSGATRTATAAGVARRFLGPHLAAPTGELTIIVANGWSPPDIGAAAALSARTAGSAVLYTEGGRLSVEAAEILRDYRPTRVVFIGGPAAITAAVKDQTRAILPDATVLRHSGATRTQTAAAIARRALGPS